MNNTHRMKFGIILTGVLPLIVTSAHAATITTDTFGSGTNTFTIDFVAVGDPGNPMDTGTTGISSSPYGAVNYAFRMGTYEISEDMITKANAAGGLLIARSGLAGTKPTSFENWSEAARFVNWLNVSSGYSPAYKFTVNPGDAGYTSNSVTSADILLWSPSDPGYDAGNLFRNRNARYFLPSENEWYKAAYYSGSGTTYFDYATGSNTIPTAVANGTAPNTAVYGGGAITGPANVTLAGGLSHYGTMGQNGNVNEWMETAYDGTNDSPSENRVIRGGHYVFGEGNLRSESRVSTARTTEGNLLGFRVASVPEPTTTLLLLGSGWMWLLKRRR